MHARSYCAAMNWFPSPVGIPADIRAGIAGASIGCKPTISCPSFPAVLTVSTEVFSSLLLPS